jgi:hypothetical protein
MRLFAGISGAWTLLSAFSCNGSITWLGTVWLFTGIPGTWPLLLLSSKLFSSQLSSKASSSLRISAGPANRL